MPTTTRVSNGRHQFHELAQIDSTVSFTLSNSCELAQFASRRLSVTLFGNAQVFLGLGKIRMQA